MRELRVSDELKFEEYGERLYLIMSERSTHKWGDTTPDRTDSTIILTPAQAESLRHFLNEGVEQAPALSAATQSSNAMKSAYLDHIPPTSACGAIESNLVW